MHLAELLSLSGSQLPSVTLDGGLIAAENFTYSGKTQVVFRKFNADKTIGLSNWTRMDSSMIMYRVLQQTGSSYVGSGGYNNGQWTYTRATTAGNSYYWLDGNKQWNSYTPDFNLHTPPLYHFVAEGTAKATFGGQIGFKGTMGVFRLSVEVNLGSLELGSVGYSYHDMNGEKFKYNYAGKESMFGFTQGANLGVLTARLSYNGVTPSVGPFVENKFKVSAYGTTYHDPNDVNYGIVVGNTILGNNSAQELSTLGYGTEKFALNPIPKVQAKPNAGIIFIWFRL